MRMLRLTAQLFSLSVGAGFGYFVILNMKGVFDGWIPWASAASAGLFVFLILYFPLFRPIADVISDRLSVAMHRGRHIRSGSGLDDLPERPSTVRCAVCGKAEGPICPSCAAEMTRGGNRRS